MYMFRGLCMAPVSVQLAVVYGLPEGSMQWELLHILLQTGYGSVDSRMLEVISLVMAGRAWPMINCNTSSSRVS